MIMYQKHDIQIVNTFPGFPLLESVTPDRLLFRKKEESVFEFATL